jgi:hypothetical protein
MATTTITLPNGSAVYHRSPGSIPATTLRRDLLENQNVANLATAMNVLDLATAIADPGASGAIPVTSSGYVPIVTAAAESRTLAVPTFAGQLLLLEMKTDGGDCTITVAQAIDEYGTTSIVLNDAGDAVLLVGVYSGANLRWRVVANRGVDTVPERGPLESLIADPGNAGAIPVTRERPRRDRDGRRGDADPRGPELQRADAADLDEDRRRRRVLTCATTVNQTGNNTVTFNDAGDAVAAGGEAERREPALERCQQRRGGADDGLGSRETARHG